MCNFFSFLITKSDIFAHFGVDSHEDLVSLSGLSDSRTDPLFVRCELLPPTPFHTRFAEWEFKTDQDMIPDWYDPATAKARAVAYLDSVPSIGAGETRDVVAGNIWFCAGNVGKVKGYSTILYVYDSAQIESVCNSAQIKSVSGSAQIKSVSDSAQIESVYGSAQIEYVCDSAQIKSVSGSAQIEYVYDSAQIKYVYGSAQIKYVCDSAQIEYVYDSAQIKSVCNSAQIKSVSGSAQIVNDKRAKAGMEETSCKG